MSIEQRINELVDKRKRWGRLHDEPVSLDEMLSIIGYYEGRLSDYDREFRVQERQCKQLLDQERQRYEREKAELHGRIGGLQKRVNAAEARDGSRPKAGGNAAEKGGKKA